jgi:TetR/AcrR family transcriptional regulator
MKRATTTRHSRRRGRGRPPQKATHPDVREALVEAARRLFAGRGFHEVGTREIAREAGVNPAMIHYYFADKEGLYRAMLERTLERLLAGFREIAAAPAGARGPIPELLRLYVGTLSRDPWLPRLMIREVLSDGAPFREEFIERFAKRAASLIPALMEQERKAGRLRGDLDPVLATLSLMGMTIFPFLAFPVAGRVFGLELSEEFRDHFVGHTSKLFFEGARGGEP